MQYFSTLPKIIYNNPITGNPIILTDLLARSSVVSSVLNNPLIYYKYDIQEGDTPDIVAYKYYGDAYRYWIVLFGNQFLDPQWNWPLDYAEFVAYINDKYQDFNPHTEIYEYQQIITQYDQSTFTTSVEILVITQSTYNSLPESSTSSYSFPDGQVSITTTKRALNYYDWEDEQNEAKRNISLINVNYVDEFERQFKKLMAQ